MKAQALVGVMVSATLTIVTACAPSYGPRPYGYGQAYGYGEQAPATVPSDAAQIVTGHTVTIESPVFNRGRLVRYNHSSIFFAADGRAYSPEFAGRRWTARGDQVCMAGGAADCTSFYQDGSGQVFAQSGGRTYRVASVVPGDRGDLRSAYQRNQATNAAAGVLALGLLGAMMSGGGGSSSSGGGNGDRYYYRQQGSGGGGSSESSYTAPIGGERGLYGSSHGVGD